MIKQFVHDMIHMTEGEKLIEYWWLWIMLVLTALIFTLVLSRGRR